MNSSRFVRPSRSLSRFRSPALCGSRPLSSSHSSRIPSPSMSPVVWSGPELPDVPAGAGARAAGADDAAGLAGPLEAHCAGPGYRAATRLPRCPACRSRPSLHHHRRSRSAYRRDRGSSPRCRRRCHLRPSAGAVGGQASGPGPPPGAGPARCRRPDCPLAGHFVQPSRGALSAPTPRTPATSPAATVPANLKSRTASRRAPPEASRFVSVNAKSDPLPRALSASSKGCFSFGAIIFERFRTEMDERSTY